MVFSLPARLSGVFAVMPSVRTLSVTEFLPLMSQLPDSSADMLLCLVKEWISTTPSV